MCVALTIPVIADVVGSFLSTEDLMSCRRVSKAWYTSYSPPFRKKATIFIRNLNDLKKLVFHPDENYSSSPHKCVRIELRQMEGVNVGRSLEKFWTVHGTSLTSVTIYCVEKCGWDILLDMLYRKTPNLKTLRVLNCFDSTYFMQLRHNSLENGTVISRTNLIRLELISPFNKFVDNKPRGELLRWILILYPNMKTLKLEGYFLSEYAVMENSMEVSDLSSYPHLEYALAPLVEIRRVNPKMFCLHQLDISGMCIEDEPYITTSFLKTLEDLHVPLAVLTIDLGTIIDVKLVVGILRAHRETLQELIVFGQPAIEEGFGNFPFGVELLKLLSLRVSTCLIVSMNFLIFTPKLQVLHIYGQRSKQNFMHEVPMFSYKSLVFRRKNSGQDLELREFFIDHEDHLEIIKKMGLPIGSQVQRKVCLK